MASAKSRTAKGASHQPVFMGNCLTITHTILSCLSSYPTIIHACLHCLPNKRVSPCVLCPPYDWANGGSADVFLHMMSMVLVLWRVGAILENRYGIQGQNYVALLQGSEMTADFHYKNFILSV